MDGPAFRRPRERTHLSSVARLRSYCGFDLVGPRKRTHFIYVKNRQKIV